MLLGERFSGYTFQIGSLYFALKRGFNVREAIPYHFIDRTVGQSKIGPEYMKNTLEFIIKMRLTTLSQNRVLKFASVGLFGALIQVISLQIWRAALGLVISTSQENRFMIANLLAIETAVVSNFMLNNAWTFTDVKLKPSQVPAKFLAFNLSSIGSIVIQMVVAAIGTSIIGIRPLFNVPFLEYEIDSGLLFVVTGILLGMIWNYFAYTRLIWKTKQHRV